MYNGKTNGKEQQDMAESKYGKYICTELKQGVVMPGFKGPQTIGQGYLDGQVGGRSVPSTAAIPHPPDIKTH